MSIVRIIPCLDVKNGRVVKGKKFKDIIDIDSPRDLAEYYNKSGADELVLYDITASNEDRRISLEFIESLGKSIDIPLIVGGGINSLEDIEDVLNWGATKVSINSGALKNPTIIKKAAEKFGSEKIVLSIDVKKIGERKWKVFSGGGREDTGMDAIEWAIQGMNLGAGELVVNSIDEDGTREGYDIDLLKAITSKITIPIIASGGAGKLEDFYNGAKQGNAQGLLAASVFHYGIIEIRELKEYLKSKGIEVRFNEY